MSSDDLVRQLEAIWMALIEAEQKAFTRCVEYQQRSTATKREKSDVVREWWGLANQMLRLFVRAHDEFGCDLKPIPALLLDRLGSVAEELSNGVIPEFVEYVRGGGRPRRRGERIDQAVAILYLEAVGRGEIEDRHPNKTVRQAYNVTAQAVRNWVKQRESICLDLGDYRFAAEKLKEMMLESGARYARQGRGAPSEN